MTLPVPYADASITSLSGSSQQALPPFRARRFLAIENTGNANIGVNPTGGVAAIGGPGTLTIVPNGSLILDKAIPNGQINVIGTAGQPVTIVWA